jgi:hypothetical protein
MLVEPGAVATDLPDPITDTQTKRWLSSFTPA